MDLQQLINQATPGSIWMRTDGSRARVLAITNLSLPSESQQKYVPVVVYVGPSGKVFSRPLKDFAGYFPTWLGQDDGAAKVINSLTTPLNAPKKPVVEPEDDSIDMSDDEPVAAPREKPVVQVREKRLASVAESGDYNDLVNRPAPPPVVLRGAFQLGNDVARKIPHLNADDLSRALRVYSQVPDEHLGLVVHKLSFELSPKLNIDSLIEAFSPDDWVNTVDVFRIGTPVSDEVVTVSAYMGVYPEFTRNVLYGTVYVGVDMIPVTNQSFESHVHTETQVSHTSAPDAVHDQVITDQPKPSEEAATVPVATADSAAGVPEEKAPEAVPTPAVADVPEPDAGEVAPQRDDAGTVDSESGGAKHDEAVVPVKVRKKRGPNKKKVKPETPVVADEELDVDSLS